MSEKPSNIAKGRSRNSRGQFVDTATAQEARIEVLEKQLTEEKRLHRLSRMSDANARGTLQQIRDYLGGDSDESALAKVERLYRECIDMGTAYEVAAQDRDAARRERNEAVAEAQAASLEIERLQGELFAAGIDREKLLRSAQEQASISRVQFTCTGLIIAVIAAGLAFFVGRWAR